MNRFKDYVNEKSSWSSNEKFITLGDFNLSSQVQILLPTEHTPNGKSIDQIRSNVLSFNGWFTEVIRYQGKAISDHRYVGASVKLSS